MSAYHKNALQSGHVLLDYTIESVLGHGGFGVTYLARDIALGALVAIKEYLPHEIAARGDKTALILPNLSREAVRDYQWGLKNFVKEARALARFKHQNIVRVLRFIEANGTAYMVMEYEEGKTLSQHLRENDQRLDEPALLRIVMPVLNGLHAVHSANLLHLDIKPENIYIRSDGSPMLIDFGSARAALSASGHLQRMTLTHGYAPVEQYPEKGHPGPWTDVYALGATMYRCVCGKRPGDALERYRAILDYKVDPQKSAAKSGAGRYRAQLLECIDWAMQLHAKDRPQSARAFQDGLVGKGRSETRTVTTSTLSGPITPRARHVGIRERAPTGSKRVGAAAVILALLSVVGVFLWIEPVVPFFDKSGDGASARTMSSSTSRAVPKKNDSQSLSSTARDKSPPTRKDLPPAIATPAPSILLRSVRAHTDWVQAVALTADGRMMASAGNDKSIRIWDTGSGAPVRVVQGYAANALAYSLDGRWLAAAGADGAVRLWDAKTGAAHSEWRGDGQALFCLAFSPDSKKLAAAGKDRTVFVWDMTQGGRKGFDGHQADVYALAFAPDGKTLASGGADRTLRLWDLVRNEELASLTGHKDKILSLTFAANGTRLASGDGGHMVRIWDTKNYSQLHAVSDLPAPVLALAFSPDGSWLVAGTADKTIQIIDADLGRSTATLTGHTDYVQALALSADGAMLASGSRDYSVKLWRSTRQ